MTDETSGGTPGSEQGQRTGALVGERYEIGDLVGRSPMAETYRARDRSLDTTVAVKFLAAQLAEDEPFAERFVAEARAAVAVKSPNIAAILDAGVDGDLRFVVQEFTEGETLAELLKREGKLEPARASEIAEEVLSALAVAHGEGISHRDVNPGNILITADGGVKLMDLGIARVETPQTVAQTRAVMGTAAYLSPEQAQGETADGRTDIYSTGIVLYEMLTGKPPFAADSPVAVAYMHVRDTATPVGEENPAVPPEMAAAVMHALAKKPEERFQTAEEFRRELAKAREGKPEGEGSAEAAPKHATDDTMVFVSAGASAGGGGPSRRTWIIIGAVVLIGLLAAGYYFFLMPKNAQVPNVTNLTLDQAKVALGQVGLEVRSLDQETSDVPAGTVTAQAPAAGKVVPQGTTVVLTVAKAVSSVLVPDVTGLSQTDAQTQLTSVGLSLGAVTTAASDTAPSGSVLSQDPAAQTLVPAGSAVNLTVAGGSTGPATVPNLVCYSVDRAATVLNEAGLKMTVGGVQPLGPNDVCPTTGIRVTSQDPPAGAAIAQGGIVTVWTSAPLPSQSPSPNPFATTSPSPSPSPSP